MTGVDWDALAKAGYEDDLRHGGIEVAGRWDDTVALYPKLRAIWIDRARAVVAAYEEQLRDQELVIVSRDDVAVVLGALRTTVRAEMLPDPKDKTWTDDSQLVRRWFSRQISAAWDRLTSALDAPGDGRAEV